MIELDPIGEEEDEDCVEDVTPPLPSQQLCLPPLLNGPHQQYQVELLDYPATVSSRIFRINSKDYAKVGRELG